MRTRWTAEVLQPGEDPAVATPARWTASAGLEYGNFRVFRYTLRLDPKKRAKSLRLPNNPYVKLFAATVISHE